MNARTLIGLFVAGCVISLSLAIGLEALIHRSLSRILTTTFASEIVAPMVAVSVTLTMLVGFPLVLWLQPLGLTSRRNCVVAVGAFALIIGAATASPLGAVSLLELVVFTATFTACGMLGGLTFWLCTGSKYQGGRRVTASRIKPKSSPN